MARPLHPFHIGPGNQSATTGVPRPLLRFPINRFLALGKDRVYLVSVLIVKRTRREESVAGTRQRRWGPCNVGSKRMRCLLHSYQSQLLRKLLSASKRTRSRLCIAWFIFVALVQELDGKEQRHTNGQRKAGRQRSSSPSAECDRTSALVRNKMSFTRCGQAGRESYKDCYVACHSYLYSCVPSW